VTNSTPPSDRWEIVVVQVGTARHPGSWIGPEYPEWAWSPMNVVVLRGPDATILIDTGPGITGSWWPFEGFRADTESALAATGITPADVDRIVLTHLDYDHAGGALSGTWPDDISLAFPAADVVIHEDAVAAARASDPDAPDNVGTRLVALLEREGRLVSARDGDEIAEGVVVRSAPGHRVGHVCVEVSGPIPFVHAADTFHNEEHVAHPEWDSSSDSDPELALATRRRVIDELADSGSRVVITHMQRSEPFFIGREGREPRLVESTQ
jgi:glyoxylase-like metal-dependent hydrolase (beta-lactamase superfamily II)